MNQIVVSLTKEALEVSELDFETCEILDYDGDRIYLAIDSKVNNYDIRTWDIREDYISYTVFRLVEDHGEDISGYCIYYY